MKNYFIILVFLSIGFFLLNQPAKISKIENIKYVKIAGQEIKVDLALTQEAWQRGLAGRKSLEENEGMLFVFDQSAKHYFWMQGMNFPIDIIWFGENKETIFIKENAQPNNLLETFGPDWNSKYILEVVAGFSEKNNLQIGDKLEFAF